MVVYPQEAYPTSGVVWHSTNPTVASVSQKGLVSAHSEGKANIYVTTDGGVISDILPVTVSNLEKLTPTATQKAAQIGYGSNYEWAVKNDNFLYWNAFLQNDSNAAKYYFQNYFCAPLFDMGEMKKLYSGVCSKDRAKEILLSFISDTYDDTFRTVKTDWTYKLAKKATSHLGKYLDNAISKDYGARLDALGEKNIMAAFEGGSYEQGISSIANYLNPDNPKEVSDLMREWMAVDLASEGFSALSKVIDLRNDISKVGNEVIELQLASQANESYQEMLDYLSNNCIDANVRMAAAEIRDRMQREVTQNILLSAAELAVNKSIDKTTDWATKKAAKNLIGSSVAAKIGYDMGVFVSNELLHAKDYLKCGDNIRLLSYISVAMTTKLSDLHLKFISESDSVKKEEYAKQLIGQYNLLIKARLLGEENYYKAYKYNPANYLIIKRIFGLEGADYEQWYNGTVYCLNQAIGNPEAEKSVGKSVGYSVAAAAGKQARRNTAEAKAALGTPYTADEFYALFKDKAFAEAVIYSLGADKDSVDWSVVTHEAVENLTELYCNEDGCISNIDGISNLKSLKYLDLSNQKMKDLPEELTQLDNLESVNLFNNGMMTYPTVLNNIASLKSVILFYNLLTDASQIREDLSVELSGNLLDRQQYQAQRYLYSAMPIIYSNETAVSDVIGLKDMYGVVYDYNGGELSVSEDSAEYLIASVNGSTNPNANIKILKDIASDERYTEESFASAFPNGMLREAVLKELGFTEESVDYTQITAASLAGISECFNKRS